MKNKSIITMLCLLMGVGMATTSCQDMLSADSERLSYTVGGDTLYSYWGILKSVQNLGERYVILGECRGDLIDAGDFVTDSVNAILKFGLDGTSESFKDGASRYLKVADYYHVINSCNAYLASADTTRMTSTKDKYMTKEYAQVEAIRAWTYLQLVINYGEVPFYLDPKLSTKDIDDFDINAQDENGNYLNKVNADNLWQKIGSRMQNAYAMQRQYGYPDYSSYGYTTTVCHSTKAMFPAEVVLGDIYLLGNQYEKAAECYYDYFRYNNGGGVLPTSYYSIGYKQLGKNVTGSVTGYPWTETGAVSSDKESVTAIPSSTKALWGTVLLGVDDLYGFKRTNVTTDRRDSVTMDVKIDQDWEQQLHSSDGYELLRSAQVYESYVNPEGNLDDGTTCRLVQFEGVGDARGIPGQRGMGYISNYTSGSYYVGRTENKDYIMKACPGGSFSNVGIMPYRKSQIWLRFAEALNRAGFPGYAFAILKNGIVKNDYWFPTEESDYVIKVARNFMIDSDTNDTIPTDWKTNDLCLITNSNYDPQKSAEEYTKYIEYMVGNYPEITDTTRTFTSGYVVTEYGEWVPDNYQIICNYISKDEMQRANGKEWLNFQLSAFKGSSTLPVYWVSQYPLSSSTVPTSSSYGFESTTGYTDETVTRGIHMKGCGMLKPLERNSYYNYEDMINKKLEEAGKTKLSKKDIYSGNYNALVEQAIEELIVDEEGLELAFEGSRFFDLLRVARRQDNPGEYMYNKIAKRDAKAESWAAPLKSDIKNWYLPLPDYSYRKQN